MTRADTSTKAAGGDKAGNVGAGKTRTDFPKADADRSTQGGAPHEQAGGSSAADRKHHADSNDAEHGYSQDSGYQGSGGESADNSKTRDKR